MRLLFATRRRSVPEDLSGSVQSTHALIRGLTALGTYECHVLASVPEGGWRYYLVTALYRLTGIIFEWRDRKNGYGVSRGSEYRFAKRVEAEFRRFKPDALLLDSIDSLRDLETAGFKPPCQILAALMHDVEFGKGSQAIPFADQTRFIGNSPFTAELIARHYQVQPTMVPPVVHLDEYVTDRPHAKHVTLISPDKRKGLPLVLELAARLPHIPFLLVEGWPMDKAKIAALQQQIAGLPNVTFRRSTTDMRTVYAHTRVLLNPSEMETFGRVVVEAQASGIPVLVSDVGALPWVVGNGGMVLGRDIEDWLSGLRSVYEDDGRYSVLSAAAKVNSRRADFQSAVVVAMFHQFLMQCVQPEEQTEPLHLLEDIRHSVEDSKFQI